jgi:hypothetical protein
MNWFDLAGTHCTLSEPKPLNAFESMGELLNIEETIGSKQITDVVIQSQGVLMRISQY